MRKGVSKQQAEDDEVLGRCIRLISTCYLKEPFPTLAQFSSNRKLDEIIDKHRKEKINLTKNELKDLIFDQGYKLKALVEDELLDYYLL